MTSPSYFVLRIPPTKVEIETLVCVSRVKHFVGSKRIEVHGSELKYIVRSLLYIVLHNVDR